MRIVFGCEIGLEKSVVYLVGDILSDNEQSNWVNSCVTLWRPPGGRTVC